MNIYEHRCQICGKECPNKFIEYHVFDSHNISIEEYWYKFILNISSHPICKIVSCNNKVSFYRNPEGFGEFCSLKCLSLFCVKPPPSGGGYKQL